MTCASTAVRGGGWSSARDMEDLFARFLPATFTEERAPGAGAIAVVPPQRQAALFQEPETQEASAVPRRRGRKPRTTGSADDALVLELEGAIAERVGHQELEQERLYVVGMHALKNPKIFPPVNTKGLEKPREIRLTPKTEPIQHNVVLLGNSITHCFTTQTLAVLAVLNDMWVEQGQKADGQVTGNYSEMVRRLKLDLNNESRGRKMVKAEMERLRRLMMIFSVNDGATKLKHVKEVTYLSFWDYIEDKQCSRRNHFKAKIDNYIVSAILRCEIASLPLKTLLDCKESESKSILLRVDSLLVHYPAIKVTEAVFFDLLSIDEDNWVRSRLVHIRQMMQKVANDLNGRVLSNGCLLQAELVEQNKRLDILFRRGECVVTPERRQPSAVNVDHEVIQRLKAMMLDAVGEFRPEPGIDSLYEKYSRLYPEELIARAISTFHADKPRTHELMSPGAFFSSVLCRLVKEQGFKWVREG